jgi:nicotinamide-nucleotide amidase
MSETAGSGGLRWAEIIAVGSELLVPPRLDTNSLFITGRLNQLGIEVRAKVIVGDRREDVAAVLRGALDRVELVVMCGGLGPTDDDLTRDAVAALLGLELVEDPQVLDRIRQRFASRGARMPETNRRQALVPVGADVLANPNGTAPGLWIERDRRILILLPGPPGELEPMFARVAAERLAPRAGGRKLCRKILSICGRTESEVEELVNPTYTRWMHEPLPIETTVLTASAPRPTRSVKPDSTTPRGRLARWSARICSVVTAAPSSKSLVKGFARGAGGSVWPNPAPAD